MHAEYIDVSKKTIESLIHHLDKNIIAVGTTSLRTVESPLAGCKTVNIICAASIAKTLTQWEPYELSKKIFLLLLLYTVYA